MCGSSSKVSTSFFSSSREIHNIHADSRRAIFHIGNSTYSSKLVDLPCIIESQKTMDNKQMFKVADICQVVLLYPSRSTQDLLRSFRRCSSLKSVLMETNLSLLARISILKNSSGLMELLLLFIMCGSVDSVKELTEGYVVSGSLSYQVVTARE